MKGSVMDLLYIFVFLLFFSTCTLVAFVINANVGPQLNALSPGGAAAIASGTTALIAWDGLFVIITFGMIMAAFVLAYFIDSHPVMFIVSFIVLIFVVMISAVLSNVYQSMKAASPDFVTAAASYPLMTQIWLQLPTIAAISGVIILILAYSKLRGGGVGV
jgi:hypothetical protein